MQIFTPNSRWKIAALAIFAGGIVLIIMLFSVTWWTIESLRENIVSQLEFPKNFTDGIIDNTGGTVDELKKSARKPCSSYTISRFKNSVIPTSDFRDLLLVRWGSIYCVSVFFVEDAIGKNSTSLSSNVTKLTKKKSAISDLYMSIYRWIWSDEALFIDVDRNFLMSRFRFFLFNKHLSDEVSGIIAFPSQLHSLFPCMPINNIVNNYKWWFLCCMLFAITTSLISYRILSRTLTPVMRLKKALMHNEFVPYIQPIVDIKNNRIKGGEVLMRWMPPEAGVIPPNKFIPLAETSGLIVPMTRELFSSTSYYFRSHKTILPKDFHLGFNISKLQLQDKNIVADCRDIINAMLPCRAKLVLELLERDPVEYTDDMKSTFSKLKEMGVNFALDDFGTGYSTHEYLQNFDIDYIKIDKSFIQMIGVDIISQHIVENIISLANNLNIDVIAEGVETVSQEIYLKERSVKYMQGYLYGYPVPLDEFVRDYFNRTEGSGDESPRV